MDGNSQVRVLIAFPVGNLPEIELVRTPSNTSLEGCQHIEASDLIPLRLSLDPATRLRGSQTGARGNPAPLTTILSAITYSNTMWTPSSYFAC